MSDYYVNASGSATWPCDSVETAAHNLGDLYQLLADNMTVLSVADTVHVSGAIVETGSYLNVAFNGAILTGVDPKVDTINIGDNNAIQEARVYNLGIFTEVQSHNGMLSNCSVVTGNRIGFISKAEYAFSWIIPIIYIYPSAASATITNNLFYVENCKTTDYFFPAFDFDAAMDSVIIADNTFDGLAGWESNPPDSLNVVIGEYILRNNIFKYATGLDSPFFLMNFEVYNEADVHLSHDHNTFHGVVPTYFINLVTPIALDATETIADPQFIGSGIEPYGLLTTSPCVAAGLTSTETPANDLNGTVRADPPNIGAIEYTEAPVPVLTDCIVARITANRKAALGLISVANGYRFTPAAIEEPRLVRNVNGRYPYMEITKAPITPETENNFSEHTAIQYLVTYEDVYNDDAATDDEILYYFRNVNAEIIRAWMVDRTCGDLAQWTKTVWYDDAVVCDNGTNVYRSAVVFEVESLIDSSNPYLLG